jgi:Ca-activated chloride channel family protein
MRILLFLALPWFFEYARATGPATASPAPKFEILSMKELEGEIEYAEEKLDQALKPKVVILLDSSGSMGQLLDKQKSKMYYAKKLFGEYLRYQWREKADVGLVVYGGRRKQDCSDFHLAIHPGERNLGKIDGIIKKLSPLGMTPIADSLDVAIGQLKNYPGPKRIMIFTDGEETCGGDSCKTLEKAIQEKIVDLEMFVTGIGLDEKSKDLDKLRCLGKTFGAKTPEKLSEALDDINNAIGMSKDGSRTGNNLVVESPDPKAMVRVYELKGDQRVYVRDFMASYGIKLPPGKYSAEVMLDPVYTFKEFTIPPRKKVTLKVSGKGMVMVKFYKGLLDVEILNRDKKVVQTFASDEPALVKSGTYDIRIAGDPFFEQTERKFKIVPGGKHEINIDGVGIVQFSHPSNVGIHVYNGNDKEIGAYLTNYPFVLRTGSYRFFLNDDCDLPGITVRNEKQIQVLQCVKKRK